MSKAKPTPMPWELRGWSIKHPGNGFRICVVEQPDKGLRQFGGGDYDDMMAECKANAELIASAPMLVYANAQQAEEIKALAARLAEAERLLTTVAGGTYWLKDNPRFFTDLRTFLRITDSAEAVQPERCCLDYPRCDCNSPPEPDNAPALQPCGHPWKAQHDSKCILCSSPGDATYAQLAEAQRSLHSADPVIHAQHGETGRMWTGPRSQLPRRYFECSAPGIVP